MSEPTDDRPPPPGWAPSEPPSPQGDPLVPGDPSGGDAGAAQPVPPAGYPPPGAYPPAGGYPPPAAYPPPTDYPPPGAYPPPGYPPPTAGYEYPAGYNYGYAYAPDPYAKSKLAAGLLGIFLGGFGVHRFYLGYTTIGIIQIIVTVLTCGLGSIWGLVEGIMILTGAEQFRADVEGRPLRD